MKIVAKLFLVLAVVFLLFQIGKSGFEGRAQAYFDEKCEKYAGEFIYRTVKNVEGLYQMRPRDDSRDYFFSLSKGDLVEDPYGHTNVEAKEPWLLFVVLPKDKYQFFETTKAPSLRGYKINVGLLKFARKPVFTGEKYWVYSEHPTLYTETSSGYKVVPMQSKPLS